MDYFAWIVVISVVCGIFWRMGGAGKCGQWYDDVLDTKWRDIGSALCMYALIPHSTWYVNCIMAGVLAWGCVSYFGWVSKVVAVFWKQIEVGKEYWWNFLAENIVLQSSVLIVRHSPINIVLALLFACIAAFGKVMIDNSDRDVFGFRKDVASELWQGFSACLLLAINSTI